VLRTSRHSVTLSLVCTGYPLPQVLVLLKIGDDSDAK
jgi:hypothetical protein